jgi:four helix bundle protein
MMDRHRPEKRRIENAAEENAFWENDEPLVVREEAPNARVYDLEERTARFGEMVVDFAKTIPQTPVTNRIINQLVGAATSVGANYVEADDAISKKEFLKNIGTCRKEAREVKHFLRMAVRAMPELKPKARTLWLEAKELHLIFCKIHQSGK